MQIEYRRNMKQSLMVLHAEEAYRGYELEMCAKNQIAGLLTFDTVVADGKMQFWYDITGMQSLETLLETKPVTVPMIEKLVRGVAWASECMRPYLLDDNKLLLRADTIYFDSRMEHVKLVYCPALHQDAGMSFRQIFEYLLPKLDYANEQAVQKTYALYQAAVADQAGIDKMVELLETDGDIFQVEMEGQSRWRFDGEESTGKNQLPRNEEEYARREHTSKEVKAVTAIKEKVKDRVKDKVGSLRTMYKTHMRDTGIPVTRTRESKRTGRRNARQQFIFEPEEELEVEHPTVYLGGPEAVRMLTESCNGRLTHQGMDGEENYVIGEKPMVIGSRLGDADIRLEADGVSRIHAIAGKNPEGEYYVEDLNSVNGTYVNGEQLAYHQKYILHKNDEIIFATEVFSFD